MWTVFIWNILYMFQVKPGKRETLEFIVILSQGLRFYSHSVWTWLGLWQRTVPEIKLQSLWTDSTVNCFSLVTFIHLQSTFTNSLYISLTWTTESLWALKPPFPETFLVHSLAPAVLALETEGCQLHAWVYCLWTDVQTVILALTLFQPK